MRGAQPSAAVKSDFFRGLGVGEFEFREVGFDFFGITDAVMIRGIALINVASTHVSVPGRFVNRGFLPP